MPALDPSFFNLLNQLMSDIPGGSIRSYGRSYTHNYNIGGAVLSGHVFGTVERPSCCAADLTFDTNKQLRQAARHAAEDLGFSGVELDLTNMHLHIDTLQSTDKITRPWHVVHMGKNNEVPLIPWLNSHENVGSDV